MKKTGFTGEYYYFLRKLQLNKNKKRDGKKFVSKNVSDFSTKKLEDVIILRQKEQYLLEIFMEQMKIYIKSRLWEEVMLIGWVKIL